MYDYHTHTSFSDDCKVPMEEMIETAVSMGVKQYAITDHYDPDYPADENFSFNLNLKEYQKSLDYCKDKYHKKIDLIQGIELGIQDGSAIEKCQKALEYPYDFVIGSFHCVDYKDIWLPFHENMSPEEATKIYYEYMYKTICSYHDFDVLGHINALDRYLAYVPDFTPYKEIMEEILKLLIKSDIGIEINTSSFRYNMKDVTMPSLDILKTYQSLGGKLVTFGSDAHFPQHICYKFDWAVEYLKSIGFKELTVFKNRTPENITLTSL